MTTNASLAPASTMVRSRLILASAAASVAAGWTGLLGPAWSHVPSPEPGVPAFQLSFSDLATATAESPSALQAAYFAWLAWLFAFLATALIVLLVTVRNRVVAGLCLAVAVVQFVLTVLAVKGPLTWTAFLDGAGNIRLGAVLALGALVLLAVAGALSLTASQRREA